MCCRANAYARVYGVPRKFNETVMLDIHSIRMVEDPHEVFFHLMEAIVVTLQHSRGKPPVRALNSLSSTSFTSTFMCATAKTLRLRVCEDRFASTSFVNRRPRYEHVYAVDDSQLSAVAK